MTNIPENSRLDRIEANLERLVQLRETDRQETAELRKTVTALVQIVEVHQTNFEASQRNFDRIYERLQIMEVEIKGLRTESLRILEHLFGPQPE
jgi:septal ring factor EnvC (AmiA/AmiB activator)